MLGLLAAAVAVALRLIFFEGLWPADAVHYVTYASRWDHIPANHWETRLLYSAVLRLAILKLGCNELSYAMPSLLPSLLAVFITTLVASYIGGVRAGLLAGLTLATLPVDVIQSTVPIAGSLGALFIGAGVASYLLEEMPARNVVGPIGFTLAILAHPTCIFLVGTLHVGAFLLASDRRERLRLASWLAATLFLYGAVELGTYWVLTGNPMYELRVIEKTSPRFDPYVPTFSREWWLFPTMSWVVSKDFGFCALLATILALVCGRRAPSKILAVVVGIGLFWLWVGYGTQSPLEFRPFWRETRFGHPFVVPLSIALGVFLSRFGRVGLSLAGVVVLSNLGLVASSGPWGQDVEISKRLLPTIRSLPNIGFISDAATLEQLYALNGCTYPDNVVLPGSSRISEFAALGAIVNPLSEGTVPRGYASGTVIVTTEVGYRGIAYVLPAAIRSRFAWLVRRPAGSLIYLEESRR